jgi:hypothetical protein
VIFNRVHKWYAFYAINIFEFFDKGPANWGSKSKATITLLSLEIVLILAICLFWLIDNPGFSKIFSDKFWLSFPLTCGLYFLNYLVVFRDERWDAAYHLFNELPRKTKILGRIVSLCITLLIPVAYIFMLVRAEQANGV